MSEIRYVKSKKIFSSIQYTGENFDQVEKFCSDANLFNEEHGSCLINKYIEPIDIGDWVVFRNGVVSVYTNEEMEEEYEILPTDFKIRI